MNNQLETYRQAGYTIIEGNYPLLWKDERFQGYICVQIGKPDSNGHGPTIWAIKKHFEK